MRRHLPLLMLLGMLVPLLVISWLGLRLAEGEAAQAEVRLKGLLADRLGDIARNLQGEVERTRFRLLRDLNHFPDRWPAAAAELARSPDPTANYFLLNDDGALVMPDATLQPPTAEQAFLRRTARIWSEGELLHRAAPPETPDLSDTPSTSYLPSLPNRRQPAPASAPLQDASTPAAGGWYVWYLEEGINLLFWRRLEDGGVLGVEVDRLGLLADLIGLLPAEDNTLPEARIQLVDAQEKILYQWGGYQPPADAAPAATRALASPLQSWRLRYHVSPAQQAGEGALRRFQLWSLLAGFAGLLLALALVLYREVGRSLREASQRVNFVNQISHELRTPLTNIRLYAELLQEELEAGGGAARRAEVIVIETCRLSRLVENVLTLASRQRDGLRMRPVPVVVDRQVEEVLEQFRPALLRLRFAIELQLNAPRPILADPDAVSQIIGNLVGNAEKYAAAGQWLRITTTQQPSGVSLEVEDLGPGIAPGHRQRIFRPFYRIRDDLVEGVSGNGIGLAISRELARLQGGDLTLEASERGARFRLVLPCSPPGELPPDAPQRREADESTGG